MKKTPILTEKTLVPIQFAITIVGFLFPIIHLYFQVNANTASLGRHESKLEEFTKVINTIQDNSNQQISRMREEFTNKLNEILISITKLNTRLENQTKSVTTTSLYEDIYSL